MREKSSNASNFETLPLTSFYLLSDVLILSQFVDSQGRMIDRVTVGICKRQYKRLDKLVRMAQKAGLMGDKDQYK